MEANGHIPGTANGFFFNWKGEVWKGRGGNIVLGPCGSRIGVTALNGSGPEGVQCGVCKTRPSESPVSTKPSSESLGWGGFEISLFDIWGPPARQHWAASMSNIAPCPGATLGRGHGELLVRLFETSFCSKSMSRFCFTWYSC